MGLTVLDIPSILRLRCGERTSERAFLAGRKRERLVRECASAKCAIPKCDANGDLRFFIFAIVHDPPSCYSRWAVLARYLWIDDGFAISSCFGADWAGIEYRDVCTVGKLSWRAVTTGQQGHDCTNSDDSRFHAKSVPPYRQFAAKSCKTSTMMRGAIPCPQEFG